MNNILQMFLQSSVDELVDEFQRTHEPPLHQVKATFRFLTDLASGVIPTTASVIRCFVQGHTKYLNDSILPQVVSNDSENNR